MVELKTLDLGDRGTLTWKPISARASALDLQNVKPFCFVSSDTVRCSASHHHHRRRSDHKPGSANFLLPSVRKRHHHFFTIKTLTSFFLTSQLLLGERDELYQVSFRVLILSGRREKTLMEKVSLSPQRGLHPLYC